MTEKKALVTGASEGIGREFAKQLAQEGYTITAVARNEERLKGLIGELGQGGHSYRIADLSKPEAVTKLAGEFKKTHYDLLVNNAGLGIYGNFFEKPLQQLQEMMRINCDALVVLSHAFLQASQKGDSLINVASTLGLFPMPSAGLYSATKAFVVSLSESLWFEQKSRGVYVMALCPGVTESKFYERAGGVADQKPPAAITQTAAQVVSTALAALRKRNKPTIVSGVPNRMIATVTRVVPRKAIVNLMGGMR